MIKKYKVPLVFSDKGYYGPCYCKVNEIINIYKSTLRFKYGECYKFINEGELNDNTSFFVYFNDDLLEEKGYRFFLKSDINKNQLGFSDYFCTFKELRRLKLEKIEHNDIK